MVEKLHIISGLPRSGSTLLSAILRQNPRFRAAVTSPVLSLCAGALEKMGPNTEFSAFFDDALRRRVLRGMISAYYATDNEDTVVFDTNRSWTSRTALLADLYPKVRIICCVREIGWIIDSIERMLRENPLQHSRVFGFKAGSSVYSRVESLMNSEKGLIGITWSSLREAWFGPEAKRLIVVRYDSLTADPAAVMTRLYQELDEPAFLHDFQNVAYDAEPYDADLGMPGLHRVRPSVKVNDRLPTVPPDIFQKHASLSFWDNPQLNPRGVLLL